MRKIVIGVVSLLLVHAPVARGEELRAVLEADNARWLAAFNTPDPAAFASMYTPDAVVLPPGTQPVTGGPEAIVRFWEARIKLGLRDHTFEIVSVRQEGRLAYQVARWTVVLVKESGERTQFTGNTVRVYELQPDGRWLTKVHIYNRHQP